MVVKSTSTWRSVTLSFLLLMLSDIRCFKNVILSSVLALIANADLAERK
jgi:hypothetical protein